MIDLQSLRERFPIPGKLVNLNLFTKENITADYLDWLNDPDVVRYSNQRFRSHTFESSVDYLNSFSGGDNLFIAVSLKDNDKYVGTMSVYFSAEHETADIGIMIGDKSCWGEGVGFDAWSAVLSFLLDVVKIRKVTGGTLECNKGMLKIMLNSGMKGDGTREAQELVNQQPQDVLHFAKFRNE